MQDCVACVEKARPPKWILPGERLVKNHAQRKDVRAAVAFLLLQNLRSHVRKSSSEARAFKRVPRGSVIRSGKLARYAEIERFHLSVSRKHDVFRLDIPVEEAGFVRRRKSRSALRGNRKKFGDR